MGWNARRTAWPTCFLLLLAISTISEAFALDAYWQGRRSSRWEHGIDPNNATLSNWYSQPPLGGQARGVPDGRAAFGPGARHHTILIQRNFDIQTMTMLDDPQGYVFEIINREFLLRGGGVVNKSRKFPNFIVGNGSFLNLHNNATFLSQAAGVRSAHIAVRPQGTLDFLHRSTGGDATAVNRGTIRFGNNASAAQMRITNDSFDDDLGTQIGRIQFSGRSNGGTAVFLNRISSLIDFENTTGPANNRRVSLGAITNYGNLRLGLNTLVVQSTFNQPEQGRVHVIGQGTTVGNLYVRGHAFLSGELRVVPDPAQPLAPGSYRVLRADGGRSGAFDLDATGLSARLDYFPNEVWLRVN
jgi:hypothetical protein